MLTFLCNTTDSESRFSGNGLTSLQVQRITESVVEGSVVVLGYVQLEHKSRCLSLSSLKDNKIKDDGFTHIAELVAANRPIRGLV